MGATSSKKKKNKKGDLADAAEGATSSLTKAIEDTTSAVTNKIEGTTKSVTEAIDSTAKNLTGQAENAVSDANKSVTNAAGGLSSAFGDLTEGIENTTQSLVSEATNTASGVADSVTTQVQAAESQVQQTTADITKGVKDTSDSATKSTQEAIDKALAEASAKVQSATAAVQKTAEDAKKEAESKVGQLKTQAEAGKSELKAQVDATSAKVTSTTESVKKDLNKLNEQGAAAVKDLERQATEARKAAETKANELKGSTEAKAAELRGSAEAKAAELRGSAEAKTAELKGNVNTRISDIKTNVDTKANELKNTANARTSELKSNADAKASELKSTASDLKGNIESKATELKGAANAKAVELKGAADTKATELKGAADAKATELKGAADNKANELKNTASLLKTNIESKATEIKGAADAKATEVRLEAEKKTTEFRSTAESRATEFKTSAEAKATEIKGQAEQLKGEADKKSQELKKSVSQAQDKIEETKNNLSSEAETAKGNVGNLADSLKSTVSGAVGGAVQVATDAAHKTVEGVGQSLSKATQDVSNTLTGAVNQVSTSVTSAAGSAVGGLLGKVGTVGSSLAQGASSFNKMAEDTLGKAAGAVGGLLPANSVAVCGVDDVKDGEMKVFKISDEGSVLLVKENGSFSALGTKCSHYGAPLAKGVLYNGTVRCPWHGACFNVKTGDIEDSPGLDSLPCYQVTVEEGQVKVHAPSDLLKHNLRTKTLTRKSDLDERTFIIIGGGGAGESCAESLRQLGFAGRLIILTKEEHLPYDRPKLSKALSSSGKEIALRSADYFKSGDIEILQNHEVASVDTAKKVVSCSNDVSFSYDKLLIATGGTPIKLDVPGSDLANIFYLRTPSDANKIAETVKDKNAVVVGTSFIGLEVASYMNGKAKSVNVVGRSKTPFVQVFGEQAGERLKKLCLEKGIKFHTDTAVSEFVGSDGKLTAVKLENGEELPADLCVIGIGVKPTTEFLKDAGVSLNEKGFVTVNQNMNTSVQTVFGAGDIVEFPLPLFREEKATTGHWQMAQTQGRRAAYGMLEIEYSLETVPFFWCALFGKSLRFAGYSAGADDYILDGDLQDMKFILYICRDDNVVAVATMGCDPVASNFASYVSSGKTLSKSEIQNDSKAWLKLTC